MKKLLIIAIIMLAMSPYWAAAQQILPNGSRSLTDADMNARGKAFAAILHERQSQIENLIKLIKDLPNASSFRDQHSKFLAIRLLGDFKTEEAVEILSENLLFVPNLPYSTYMTTQGYYPSAMSLVQIGLPSIEAMQGKIIDSNSDEERNLAAWVIMKIDGPEIAAFRLHRRAEMTAGNSKKRLLDATEYIKNFKPTIPAPASYTDKLQIDIQPNKTQLSSPAKPKS